MTSKFKIKPEFYTPLAVLLGSILISLSVVFYGLPNGGNSQVYGMPFEGPSIDLNADIVFGNKKSDTALVLYSDPECPYCITLYPNFLKIYEKYKDDVMFVYRHFPLTSIHPDAVNESSALECAYLNAGEEGFLKMMDKVYGDKARASTNQMDQNKLKLIAFEIGINETVFENCRTATTTIKKVMQDLDGGQLSGVQGTPTAFLLTKVGDMTINRATIDGARPFEYFDKALQAVTGKK